MAVFVLDKRKKPLMPCSEKRARLLLQRGRAVVHQLEPFTIRLKDRTQETSNIQPQILKLDPGSNTTGFSLIRRQENDNVILLGELHHKKGIKEVLESRRSLRRNRRNRKTRYREARFDNRKRKKGWLPPSLEARVNQTLNLVKKIRKLTPISSISSEWTKFDTQKIQNPEISGVEYQQGELQGYEVREYLLEKFGRKCAYCEETGVALEVEHFIAKSKGGTNRVSNLTISCRVCNEDKGNLYPHEWMEKCRKRNNQKDKKRIQNIPLIEQQLKKPLKDAALMNATRYRLVEKLKEFSLPLELSTGAKTKMNRIQVNLQKQHYFDACCVGTVLPLSIQTAYVYVWSAMGRGNRQMARVDKYGFPLHHNDVETYDKDGNRKGHRRRQKQCHGFQTGDIVKTIVTKGKKQGVYVGRVAIRHSGSFNIKLKKDGTTIQGIHHKYCQILQRNDGWFYQKKKINL